MAPLTFFELSTASSRGDSLKIVEPRCRLDVRKFSFAHRGVEMWNSSDNRTVACDSIISFKNRFDKSVYGRGFVKALRLPSLVNCYTILY